MKRKAISILLIASIVASVSGCSFGKKFSEKKYIKFLEDELDLEEVDPDDVEDIVSEDDEFAFYFYANAKETRNLVWERIELEDYFPSTHGVESSITFVDGSLNGSMEVVSLLSYEDEEDAIDFIEEVEEKFEVMKEDFIFVDDYYADKDQTVAVAYDEFSDGYMCFGAFRVDNRVFVMTGMNDEPEYDFDDFDDLCEEFGLDNIEDLLY